MSMKNILLGFEVGTGKPVHIGYSHLIVTGITQLSGKTTTLEALISRSGQKAVVFKTKIGESGFSSGTMLPPYYKEKSGWQYVLSVLEATLGEKLKFQRPWIIKVCENTTNLLEVKNRIDELLASGKVKGLNESVYTELQAFLKIVLPQFQKATFSNFLELEDGINIMDLERFSDEMQSLVIESVLDTVQREHRDIIVVMPEAWKFLPQERGNPCKKTADAFIRQGAGKGNFLWVDSQDIANVDKAPLKSVSTWILGLQQERNEVKHTIDQMPVPKTSKPKEDEIMTLPIGHFFACTQKFMSKVYVQPAWLDEESAKKVAMGKLAVPTRTEALVSHKILNKSPDPVATVAMDFVTKTQLNQLRLDFFKKLDDIGNHISGVSRKLMEVESSQKIVDIDEVTGLVMQKLPVNLNTNSPVSEEAIIRKVLERVPSGGQRVFQVSPLEKLKRDFQTEAKSKILEDIKNLTPDERKYLSYVEAKATGVTQNEMITKCFILKIGGSSASKMSNLAKMLTGLSLLRKDTAGRYYPNVKPRIEELVGQHGATPEEINEVYNHILAELCQ